MKQTELVRQLYQACMSRDAKAEQELFLREMAKIFKRRMAGKRFSSKWTVAD